MRDSTRLVRGLGVLAGIAGAAFGLAACTYVERTPPAPAATVVTPPPQQPTVVAPASPPPTVTVRPSY